MPRCVSMFVGRCPDMYAAIPDGMRRRALGGSYGILATSGHSALGMAALVMVRQEPIEDGRIAWSRKAGAGFQTGRCRLPYTRRIDRGSGRERRRRASHRAMDAAGPLRRTSGPDQCESRHGADLYGPKRVHREIFRRGRGAASPWFRSRGLRLAGTRPVGPISPQPAEGTCGPLPRLWTRPRERRGAGPGAVLSQAMVLPRPLDGGERSR